MANVNDDSSNNAESVDLEQIGELLPVELPEDDGCTYFKPAKPRRFDPDKLEFFHESEESEIKLLARGLSTGEVLDHWAVSFVELSKHDRYFFQQCYRQGRVNGKATAVDRLFKEMNVAGKGKDACMAYLLRFSDSWPDDVEDKAGGHVYKLMME